MEETVEGPRSRRTRPVGAAQTRVARAALLRRTPQNRDGVDDKGQPHREMRGSRNRGSSVSTGLETSGPGCTRGVCECRDTAAGRFRWDVLRMAGRVGSRLQCHPGEL